LDEERGSRQDGIPPPGGDADERARGRWLARLEIYAAILMAFATIATAWASYQSARWDGIQALRYGQSGAARLESTRATARGDQLRTIDVTLFSQALDAYGAGDERLTRFYVERFRDEFRPAFDAWLATEPRTNPDAPPSPFSLPEYQVAELLRADELVRAARALKEEALEANQRSDNYVLAVAVFAAALFFAGVGSRVASPWARVALLGVATLGFVANAAWVATFPVTASI
jgi:hypothetical protein